jgi:predicted RecB family nuclease
MAMPPQITADVLEAFLHCRYKGHLKQAGQMGTRSDYEVLAAEQRSAVRQRAIEQVTARHADGEVISAVPLTTSTLKQGTAFVVDATLEDGTFSLRFDGLKRADGASKLGDYHYVPVLFHGGGSVRKEQRLLLDVFGLLLSRVQGRTPGHGIVWHGRECRATKVRLSPDLRKAERLLRDVQEAREAEPPRLILNDHCQVCEFRQRCHQQAVQEDNISLLRGMKEKEIKGYSRKGILTLTQLAHTFRPRRWGKRAARRTNHRYHALQALAVRDKRVYLFGTPELPGAAAKIYFDIEGLPEEGFIYLIGMTVVRGESEERYSFWADTQDQEKEIFEQFLAQVSQYEGCRLFCYGGYERAFLKRMRNAAGRKQQVDRVLANLVNVLSVVYAHVYFPCHSNGLKDVGRCLGFSWTDPEASGVQSIAWRRRWEAGHLDGWKEKLVTYNREDCAALRKVTEFLSEVGLRLGKAVSSGPAREGEPLVASVEELDRLGTVNRRGKIKFFHPDYDYINGCAHFDYQRERVYVRTGKGRRRSKTRKALKASRFVNRGVRVSQRVQIVSRKCPSCGSGEVTQWATGKKIPGHFLKHKTSFDLVFTPSGIKRKVIECRSAVHECGKCGKTFVPDRYQRLAKHFHGLKSWAIYEHVAHRISCPMLTEMLREYFGLAICQQEVNLFKEMMARYYQPCCKRMLAKMLSGPVLHVDETEVKLRTGKGYVWVFTTAEEVVYMYRPTREGDFLPKLLKDFRGVLVSDYYAAYDSLPCPQQKCLIHLIRDMNQELLNNPFDKELQTITGPFGVLLRAVVECIDQHGLKKRFLGQHERDVAIFFQSLAKQTFRSDAAEGLRGRLTKNQDKLFTFIRYDGVPWNNNNAENAIRRFAYYRDENPGRIREAGLKDYLVLLSICHACRYKGVSFLKFLLSQERDMDAFCQAPTRRRHRPTVEVYPKGVERPDFRPSKMAASRQTASNDAET